MANETGAVTGDEIRAKIGTQASGVAVGSEIQQTTVNVGRDSLDDVKTDIHFIQNDLKEMRYAQFEFRSTLKAVQDKQDQAARDVEYRIMQAIANLPQIEPKVDLNERTIRVIAIIFALIVAATFIMLLYAASRGIVHGN